MSFAFRVLLRSLALSLSLNGSIPPQTPASTPSPPQSSDEETVRTLTERYALAITSGSIEAMSQFWNPQSSNLATRLVYYRGVFSNARIEFIRLKITRLEVTGDKAVSHLTSDERHLDKITGAVSSVPDVIHGPCRSLEWIKIGAVWKIEREVSVQGAIAARLEAAASARERDEILGIEKAFVGDALVYSISARGNRYRGRGDYDVALRCYQLSQALAEKIGDQAGIAGAWLNIGILKSLQYDYEQTLKSLQTALALYEAANLKRGVALAQLNLSKLYRTLGDHRQAFDCAQKSLRIYEEANLRDGTAAALDELASVYTGQNNFHQALAYLERALAIAHESGNIIGIAMAQNAVADQHLALGAYEKAREIYRDLLNQTEGAGDQMGAAAMRESIGRVFAAQGRYDEALDHYRRALSVVEAANNKRNQGVVLKAMSRAYLAQEKYAEALPLAERSVSLLRQSGWQFDLWLALTALGYSQLGLNRTSDARQSFVEAISIIEKLREQTVGGIEERQRYFEGGLSAYHGMLSLLVMEGRTQEALELAERAKARALLDTLQQGRIIVQKTMTAEEQEQEGRLKSELTRLNNQLTRATQSEKQDAERVSEIKSRLEKARLSYEAFQTSLYAAHPELKVHRGEASIIKADELAALLPDAERALLKYVVADDRAFLFAITKAAGKTDVEVSVYTLPVNRDALAKQTEAYRRQLATRDLGFRASAVKLYELLLKPAEAQLRGKTNLVIAPDNTLWDLPFQALLDSANRFLIENAAITYTPSLTVMREITKRRKNQGADSTSATLLALGNPKLDPETINRAELALRDEKLDPLPEAEQEVKALRRIYGMTRSKVYIGAEAREDRVKSEAGQARIIHFATHGMMDNASPMYSHLALARGGANEDGLLEAWELMRMDLKADLAVLSACETARGRFGAGEGMIGLSWALFVAGVPSTMVSQWKVESASTRDLMLNFHRQLRAPRAKGKLTKAAALRQAGLKLMKNPETSHPFYWAGFVLVGDGR